MDQPSSYSTSVRKFIRWYHKVATEILLGTSVVNALIVYNKIKPEKNNVTQFRENVLDEMLGLDKSATIEENENLPLTFMGRQPREIKKHEKM